MCACVWDCFHPFHPLRLTCLSLSPSVSLCLSVSLSLSLFSRTLKTACSCSASGRSRCGRRWSRRGTTRPSSSRAQTTACPAEEKKKTERGGERRHRIERERERERERRQIIERARERLRRRARERERERERQRDREEEEGSCCVFWGTPQFYICKLPINRPIAALPGSSGSSSGRS